MSDTIGSLLFDKLVSDICVQLLVQRLEAPPCLIHLFHKSVGLIGLSLHLGAIAEAVQSGGLIRQVNVLKELKRL